MGRLPRTSPPSREDNVEMIRSPEEWPLVTWLPLKRPRDGKVGYVLASDLPSGVVTVYVGLIVEDRATLPVIRYVSADAAVDDGWIVD